MPVNAGPVSGFLVYDASSNQAVGPVTGFLVDRISTLTVAGALSTNLLVDPLGTSCTGPIFSHILVSTSGINGELVSSNIRGENLTGTQIQGEV